MQIRLLVLTKVSSGLAFSSSVLAAFSASSSLGVTSTSLSVPDSSSGGGRFPSHATHKTPKFSAACGGHISSKLRISHESEGFCPQF